MVAQDDDQRAQAGHLTNPTGGAARQDWEQNFTSSQLRAQRFRQVIGRPHAAQGLLGSDCLLPLNVEDKARLIWTRLLGRSLKRNPPAVW